VIGMTLTETNAFLTWFSTWGQTIYFFAQIIFWVFIAAAAVEIALSYKRYVDHKTGAAQAKAEKKAAEAAAKAAEAAAKAVPAAAAPVSPAVEVDKFVE
jgi:hypothetical protein